MLVTLDCCRFRLFISCNNRLQVTPIRTFIMILPIYFSLCFPLALVLSTSPILIRHCFICRLLLDFAFLSTPASVKPLLSSSSQSRKSLTSFYIIINYICLSNSFPWFSGNRTINTNSALLNYTPFSPDLIVTHAVNRIFTTKIKEIVYLLKLHLC